jgi:hypothetical protein
VLAQPQLAETPAIEGARKGRLFGEGAFVELAGLLVRGVVEEPAGEGDLVVETRVLAVSVAERFDRGLGLAAESRPPAELRGLDQAEVQPLAGGHEHDRRKPGEGMAALPCVHQHPELAGGGEQEEGVRHGRPHRRNAPIG